MEAITREILGVVAFVMALVLSVVMIIDALIAVATAGTWLPPAVFLTVVGVYFVLIAASWFLLDSIDPEEDLQ